MNHHNKYSIVIPTKNRSTFINRVLNYYAITKFSGFIYIGDSSNKKETKKNKENINKFKKKLNIKYREYPSVGIVNVIYYLLKDVKTQFASFLSDDDFLITSAINPSIEYLLKNKDVACVNGRSFLFTIDKDKPFGKISFIHPYTLGEINMNNSSDRLLEYFEKLKNVNISIQRTKNITEAYGEIAKLPHFQANFNFDELIHATITLVKGKVIKLDSLFLVRQGHANQMYRKMYKKFYDWIIDDNWSKSYHSLEKIAIAKLNNNYFKNNNPEIFFRKMFFSYLSKQLFDFNNRLNKKKLLKNGRFNNKLHNNIKKLLIKFHLIGFARFFKGVLNKKNKNLLDELLDISSRDHKDFMPLYNVINNTNVYK